MTRYLFDVIARFAALLAVALSLSADAASPPFDIPTMHGRSGEDLRLVYLEQMGLQDLYLFSPDVRASHMERGCIWAEYGSVFSATVLKVQFPELELTGGTYVAVHRRDPDVQAQQMSPLVSSRHAELEQANVVFELEARRFCLGIAAERYGRLHHSLIESRMKWEEDFKRSMQWQKYLDAFARSSSCTAVGQCAEANLRNMPGPLLFQAGLMMAAGFLPSPWAPTLPVRWQLTGGALLRAVP